MGGSSSSGGGCSGSRSSSSSRNSLVVSPSWPVQRTAAEVNVEVEVSSIDPFHHMKARLLRTDTIKFTGPTL